MVERGVGGAVILKGCEQVATPPARTLQHRNSGNFIRPRQQQQQGCSLNTCKCMKAHTHTWCHIDAPIDHFLIRQVLKEGRNVPRQDPFAQNSSQIV